MRKVLSNNARPSFFVDANRDLAFAARHHDWPLDDAGVGQHQDACAGGIAHLGLHAGIELAPGRALAVDQGFPTHLAQPMVEGRGIDAFFFEVMELVVVALFFQPDTNFLDTPAVGNAVDMGCRIFHAAMMPDFCEGLRTRRQFQHEP